MASLLWIERLLNMPDPFFCANDLTYIVDSSRSLRLDMDILHLFSFDSCNHGSCDMWIAVVNFIMFELKKITLHWQRWEKIRTTKICEYSSFSSWTWYCNIRVFPKLDDSAKILGRNVHQVGELILRFSENWSKLWNSYFDYMTCKILGNVYQKFG